MKTIENVYLIDIEISAIAHANIKVFGDIVYTDEQNVKFCNFHDADSNHFYHYTNTVIKESLKHKMLNSEFAENIHCLIYFNDNFDIIESYWDHEIYIDVETHYSHITTKTSEFDATQDLSCDYFQVYTPKELSKKTWLHDLKDALEDNITVLYAENCNGDYKIIGQVIKKT